MRWLSVALMLIATPAAADSVWIIITGADRAAIESRALSLQTGYRNLQFRRAGETESEKIGELVYNNTGTKAFTATTRGNVTALVPLADSHAWLTVTDNPRFLRDAEWRR